MSTKICDKFALCTHFGTLALLGFEAVADHLLHSLLYRGMNPIGNHGQLIRVLSGLKDVKIRVIS